MIKKIFLSLFLYTALLYSQSVIKKGDIYYLSNTLIVKFRAGISVNQNSVQSLFQKNSIQTEIKNCKQVYPSAAGSLLKGEAELSRIFYVEYNSAEDPITLSKKISNQKDIEYAEPRYIHRVTYVPNDSLYNFANQADLSRVLAEQAWDITKGSSSVIIGIVDTGVDWQHPDLAANILKDVNGKPVGIDFGGLNGAQQDDDPNEDPTPASYGRQAYHGTHVAGTASAVSNNKTGVASIGYNCSIIPVKVSRSDIRDDNGYPLVYYGYDGIKWAADHGAKVINCSWGGSVYSRYEQNIIDYVTNKGALVVAAQGNDGKQTSFYPANYKNVLSVGWSDNNDNRNPSANYGKKLNVMAPGSFILSTWPKVARNVSNDYNNWMSGSSMAAPHAAGLAGLVATKFPNYTPQQIAEQIRVTSDDNIYQINNADSVKYLLGKGRINAYRAVTETNAVSVRISDVSYLEKGDGNGLFERGEEGTAQISLTNYLNTINNLQVSVECKDAYVVISEVTGNSIAAMNSGETLANRFLFKFTVQTNSPYDHDVDFLVKFSAGTYSDFQWLTVRINPTYDTQNSNKVALSITSKGTLGFNDYPANLYGSGFRFGGGDNLLFEGAFMYGTSSTKIMDAARVVEEQSKDFIMQVPIKLSADKNGNQVGVTTYNDSGAGTSALGIETKQTSYSFVNSPDDKYIIIENQLLNKSGKDITNLYTGYFFDWDMPANDSGKDSTAYDAADNFGYAFYQNKTVLNTIVGAALVSSANYGYYPINNAASSGDVRLFDTNGYTDSEKWISLSSGIVKKNDGYVDVSFVVSGGPFAIAAGKSLKVAYAIAAADNIGDLKTAIRQSRTKYQTEIITAVNKEEALPDHYALLQNYPNPFNPSTTISYKVKEASNVTLKVYDLLGRETATLVNEFKQPGNYNCELRIENGELTSGVYFYTLRAGNFIQTKKMILLK